MKRLCHVLLCAILCLCAPATFAQTVDFTADKFEGCEPLAVRFTNLSSPGAISYDWNFQLGANATDRDVDKVFGVANSYNVTLTVTYPGNITRSVTKAIRVHANPIPLFTVSGIIGCSPYQVNFRDQSQPGSGTITRTIWDYGDGVTETAVNPSHIYNTPGSYPVSNIVTNSFGCSKGYTLPTPIVVNETPRINFTASNNTSCTAPLTVNFTNSGPPGATYTWDFGDPASGANNTSTAYNATHAYNQPGRYTVVLRGTLGNCTAVETKYHYVVIQQPVANFDVPATICAGQAFTLTNTTSPNPTVANWTFSDGTVSTAINPTKTFANPGTYRITLQSGTPGCLNTTFKDITVNPSPVAAFSATPRVGCSIPFTTNFTNQSTGATSWNWNFGDGGTSTLASPSHTYTNYGEYDVTLQVRNAAGCVNTVTLNDYIRVIQPVVNFTPFPREGCLPFTTTFTPNMTVGGPIATYLWDFGDGTTSTAANPSHTYTTEGVFTITLTVTTADGCTVTTTNTIRAGRIPVVAFDADPKFTCQRFPVQFTNQSVPRGTEWTWLLPQDNATLTEENPRHVFNELGYHDVTLIVNNYGCIRQLTKTQFIQILPPIANFDLTQDCANKFLVQFNDLSNFGPNPPIRNWHWDFGDGTTSTQQSPAHTYATTGTYTITLVVDNGACTSEHTMDVTIINETPVIQPNISTICANNDISFTISNIDPANIRNYSWDFGDGTTSTSGTNPVVKRYTRAGTYYVVLTVTDNNGCVVQSNTVTLTITGALADFTFSGRNCNGDDILFSDASATTHSNGLIRWVWDFNDGSPLVVQTTPAVNFPHAFAQDGTYNVSLTVQDASGCNVTVTKPVRVITVRAAFDSPNLIACKQAPVQFNNQSAGQNLIYQWSFGDTNTSVQQSPIHNYAQAGTYDVTLIAINNLGCSDTLTRAAYIRVPDPVAHFSTPTDLSICPPIEVIFNNESTDVNRVEWDFGDNSISSILNPRHIYTQGGTYNITLTVYSDGDCVSTYAQPITLRGPSGTKSVTPKEGCADLTVNFSATSSNAVSYIWDFDDGKVNITTTASIQHTYDKPGKYVPRVLLEDEQGCKVLAAGNDTIVVDKITPDFTMTMPSACDSALVTFNDASIAFSKDQLNEPLTYAWDFGNTQSNTDTSSRMNPQYLYTRAGTFTATLHVTSRFGCAASITKDLLVEPRPDAIIAPVTPICGGDTLRFSGRDARNLPGDTWFWNVDGVRTFTTQETPRIPYILAGNYNVQFIVTNQSGLCKDTAYLPFTVNPGVNLRVAPQNVAICRGQYVTMLALTNNANITWTDYNISSTNVSMPIAHPDIDTTYFVTASNAFGCTKTDSVKVRVSQPFTVRTSDVDICEGQQAQLHVTGAIRYEWTPAANLSSTTSANPIATPTSSAQYTVTGYGNDACFTSTAVANVNVHTKPLVELGTDHVIPAGSPFNIPASYSEDVVRWEWTPVQDLDCSTCGHPILTPRSNQQLTVKVTSRYGCENEDKVNVKIVCSASNVFLPNTFSPNNDGVNDIFYIRGRGVRTVKLFRIFNRWGQLVFERTNFNVEDPAAGWDGKFKGNLLNPDVFVYYAELTCDTGEPLTLKGNVTILR
ncbi:gliding motility-associated-like protein [Chitinophaga skermanii]|uniref:Gliding motility-associated-like protein n=1 Tax=Chitinophaga skermanii TaxID=331697 RepID=A0A327Q7W5_9BACT|nr:PKD domain-containing protein [Chitinophaga skermanii]RAI99897.1 gliding motility-associated-like protein [Chitinophaga skermanii]